MCACKNCGSEMPLYFEKGKKIDWSKVKKECQRCKYDGGWEISK